MDKPKGTISERACELGRERVAISYVTVDTLAMAIEERFTYIESHLTRIQLDINEICKILDGREGYLP